MCCPADIFAAASTPVKLYVNSEIKSVRIDLYTGFCANSPPASYSWVNDAVKVELYCGLNASSTMIGKVMFGHLRNRESYVSEGQIINQPNINGRTLGILGSSFCSCNCYPTSVHGHHTHMGRTSGNSGTTNSWNCWQNVTTGFWVYRWYLSNCAT